MRILVCGAHGFVGRHLSATLSSMGHKLIHGVRHARTDSKFEEISINYQEDTDPELWRTRLANLKIDLVINAVGILNESKQQSFLNIHQKTPIALFQAAHQLGLRGLIQISALGPDDAATPPSSSAPLQLTDYLTTKRQTDTFVATLGTPHLIIRPSLIVGDDGASSQFFRLLASLPIIGLPGDGEQQLQPVHIDDICAAVCHWLNTIEQADAPQHTRLSAVGPEPMSYRKMLAHYRQAMGLGAALWIKIPLWCMHLFAQLAVYLPQRVFSPETLTMLAQGSVADPRPLSALIKRQPRAAEHWFDPAQSQALACTAISLWENQIFRAVLALLWLASGIIPLFFYPHESSFALLAPLGLHGEMALVTLIGASCIDILLGLATLLYPSKRLWIAQILLVILYSALISFFLPEFLWHPFAPILKNLPVLAILFSLLARERK